MVSMIESGRGRIRPESYRLWAAAMDLSPREFVENIMKYYDPIAYEILFEDDP